MVAQWKSYHKIFLKEHITIPYIGCSLGDPLSFCWRKGWTAQWDAFI